MIAERAGLATPPADIGRGVEPAAGGHRRASVHPARAHPARARQDRLQGRPGPRHGPQTGITFRAPKTARIRRKRRRDSRILPRGAVILMASETLFR